ncbi:MAG TPA: cellulose biosynthesis cyclic di-GMP-binding regulatory protein BcsB [Solirubrobacteraceae bacterium]|jgi:cellulose synthase/poly-beta-1,6-N-acetylglucosamine synthase-like glycosyltransferase|nr:cellulose biosynthesis cyclic di-GMP-binding regulatory protein BcsB [Solirubrobacteraceae bacterium]
MKSLLRRVRVGGWLLAPATLLVAIVIPAVAYTLIDGLIPGSLPMLQYVVASAYALTAMMTLLEARAALGSHDEPRTADIDDLDQLAELPTLTAIVSAYLPNEQELVADTIVHLATELRVAPGSLQIILAYNTPQDMPDVEGVLRSLAELNVAFLPLRVPHSRSKSENVNAAMGLIRGEVTVLLDADHRPARDAAARALRWFASGYDIVQGRCVIRDSDTNWLSRIVAVEFEQIYAVSHSGRSLAFDTAMFCGTNGWWRTSVLRRIGMDDQMLTEDIDSSVRALLAGYRTVHDRSIVSTELAPPSPKAWWGQRMRWAQGWFQVTLRHQAAIVRSPRLSSELKLYWTYLLGWRELFPVLSLQIFALLLANVLLHRRFAWFYDPYLIITTVLTVVAGPLAAVMTYRVALEDQRRELRRWFFIYAAGSLIYTTVKNTVAMVATVRELVGQRGWIVTSRKPTSRRAAVAATTSALAVLAVAGLASPATPSAQARPLERAVVVLRPLTTSLGLTGRAPVTMSSVPVPDDWATAGGVLHLRWQTSATVTPNSTLVVRVDGAIMATRALRTGVGRMTLRIPQHAVSDHRLDLEVDGQLHTRIDATCCIPDAATGAVVAIDAQHSYLDLAGRRSDEQPLLADLPGSLVDLVGNRATPLYVALPSSPTAEDIRAGAIMAGAVARATRSRSVPVQVVRGVTPAHLRRLPGQVVEIVPTGRPSALVRRRADGRLVVRLGGSANGVVTAAWALARRRPGFIPGSRARISSGLGFGSPPAARSTATISPNGAQGTGALQFNSAFRIPEGQLTGGKAKLDVLAGFTAPAGGRLTVGLNGQDMVSRNLPRQGLGQMRLVVNVVQDPVDAFDPHVALGTITPGDNFITVRASLPPGQPVGGSGDAQVPEIRVLPGSLVSYDGRPRSGAPVLDLWPWPFETASALSGTTFVLPADPDPKELAMALRTVAEAARWTTAPVAPRFALAPASLPAGDLVVLARGETAPVTLPAGAPLAPRPGVLETYSSGGRRLLVAYGVRALRPLAADYFVGKVKGVAAITSTRGTITTLAPAPAVQSFKKHGPRWQVPTAILVVFLLGLLGLRLRKVRRRLDDLPPPAPSAALDDEAVRAQLADWEQLVTQDASNGAGAHDDVQTRP